MTTIADAKLVYMCFAFRILELCVCARAPVLINKVWIKFKFSVLKPLCGWPFTNRHLSVKTFRPIDSLVDCTSLVCFVLFHNANCGSISRSSIRLVVHSLRGMHCVWVWTARQQSNSRSRCVFRFGSLHVSLLDFSFDARIIVEQSKASPLKRSKWVNLHILRSR